MILIPEIETVVILVPRTGTTSIKRACFERYPRAMMPYRHMEADGVPHGYNRWRRVGVVRDPVDRLFSLFRYLKRFGLDYCNQHNATYTRRMRESVAGSFSDWLLSNELPFTTPFDSEGRGRYYPEYTCLHPLPENRKSQFLYLRPDLGTEIYSYHETAALFADLDISPGRLNVAPELPAEPMTAEASAYMAEWFAWDRRRSATGKGYAQAIEQ